MASDLASSSIVYSQVEGDGHPAPLAPVLERVCAAGRRVVAIRPSNLLHRKNYEALPSSPALVIHLIYQLSDNSWNIVGNEGD